MENISEATVGHRVQRMKASKRERAAIRLRDEGLESIAGERE